MSKYLEQFAKLRCRDDVLEALGEEFVNRKNFRRDLVQAMAMIRFIRKHIPQNRQRKYNLFDLHSTNQVFPVLAAFMTKFGSIHVCNEQIHRKNDSPACRDFCRDAEPERKVNRLFYHIFDADSLKEASEDSLNVIVSILPEDPSDILETEFPDGDIDTTAFFLNPRCGELPKSFNLGSLLSVHVRIDPIDMAAPSKLIVGGEILVVNQDWNVLSEHDVMIYSGWLPK